MPNDGQDITRSLAIAFDRVWDSYYRAGRLTLTQVVVRNELARRLVQLSREGVRDEQSLAKAALRHLRQLPGQAVRSASSIGSPPKPTVVTSQGGTVPSRQRTDKYDLA
jgi:hypothetical protein